MNVTRFHWLRRVLSATEVSNRLRPHLRAFHADTILSFLATLLSRPFSLTTAPAIIIAPHQDDETLGCGGLIALKRRNGIAVDIVFMTDGAKAPLPVDGSITSEDLPQLRAAEAHTAAAALGVLETHLHFLRLPDSCLPHLTPAQREEIIIALQNILAACGPGEVYVPHQSDGHGDHEASYILVMEAVQRLGNSCQLFQYLIWRPWLYPVFFLSCLKELSSTLRLPIDNVLPEKIHAIGAYASQIATLPFGFLARFRRPYELFVPVKQSNLVH